MDINLELRRCNDNELAYWLAFQQLNFQGFRSKNIEKLIDRCRGAKEAWTATRDELLDIDPANLGKVADAFIAKRSQIDPEALLIALRKTDIDAYPFLDPRYPFRLREISDAPCVLFVRGKLHDKDFDSSVGIVGTRRPTSYGSKWAKENARSLAQHGVVVVSGLALGIDSLSHWGAIEGGGRTIAVLASGADHCYPSSNKPLFEKILEGNGALVSEFFPGVPPDKWHFPARNRIIAGIPKAVIVVEAGEQSGALITAELANDYSRDVFAVPGRTDSPMSVGTNRLIAKSKAKLITNFKDAMDEMSWVKGSYKEVTTIVELYGREKDIYEMLGVEPMHFDVLCHQASMEAGEMSATLTMLELAGLVVRHPGDWYTKVHGATQFVQPELPTLN